MISVPQLKLFYHSDRVEEWIETNKTSPVLVEIAPTAYCNASCPWCFFKNRQTGKQIDTDIMMNTIEDIAKLGVKAINWTGGGEPTLHPNFNLFISYASHYGLKQGLFTNGYETIPKEYEFEWIRISLTDEGFDKIKKPIVPFGICVNDIEDYSAEDLRNLCLQSKDFGASYFQVRPALVGSYKIQPRLEAPKYLKEYNTKDFKVYITDYKYIDAVKSKEYDYCYGYHFCPSIDWNGNVGVCLYMTDKSKFVFGNLNKLNFSEIWKTIPEQIKVVDCCQNCCKNHEINKILYNVRNIKSVDFL